MKKTDRTSLIKSEVPNPLWPDAKWHLPGLMEIEWMAKWLDALKNVYDYEPIGAVYGSPNIIWNSGRMVTDNLSRNLPFALDRWKRSGIKVLLTLSNPLLTESECGNPVSNHSYIWRTTCLVKMLELLFQMIIFVSGYENSFRLCG